MGKLLRRRWVPADLTGLSRRDRAACDYDAYIPDRLSGARVSLDGDVAADVADAERAVMHFNGTARALGDTEALARLLLRADSVASSHIEGLEIGARRLLRAGVARELGDAPMDVTASEVLANIDAMSYAMRTIRAEDPIALAPILEVHRRLLAGGRLANHAGRIRTEQNWIGGSAYNPCSAAFVPPPPEDLDELLADLCAFCNEDGLPALVQAALAHAQFETIHPFVDGNGRVGRTLIHMILRKRGLATRVLPPVSLILATEARAYIEGLVATQWIGAWNAPEAHAGRSRWIGRFAAAMQRAVADAEAFERAVRTLQASWRTRLAPVRADSALDRLLHELPATPVLTVRTAADRIGRSEQAVNEAVARLVAASVLKQTTAGRRSRAFEAPELITLFTDLERRFASPTADTRSAPPVRPVPYRRRNAPRH